MEMEYSFNAKMLILWSAQGLSTIFMVTCYTGMLGIAKQTVPVT